MKRFIRRITGLFRTQKGRHPSRFRHYVKQAGDCVKKQGGRWVDKRDSKWKLVVGRPITNFGERDWVWAFRGQQVLGICMYTNPMKVMLGSDGHHYNRHTALHEAGHVGLMQAGDFGHNPKYRACFQGWSDTGHRLPADIDTDYGCFAVVDFVEIDEDGCVKKACPEIVCLTSKELAYLESCDGHEAVC